MNNIERRDDAFINPPFYCDYGKHIEVGKNFFANFRFNGMFEKGRF